MPEAIFPDYITSSYDTLEDGSNIPIPALAVDSDFISLIGVKMALEILLAEDHAELKDSPNVRLWGNKKKWIFKEEFQSLSINNQKFKSIENCIILRFQRPQLQMILNNSELPVLFVNHLRALRYY